MAATYQVERERAARAEEEASEVLRDSIRELSRRENLSTRDIAAVLELSLSRVDPLKHGHVRRAARGDVRSGRRVRAAAAPKNTAW